MSDLLSPLLVVMGNEVDAFWAFVALMDRMEPNFHTDQRGMHAQLLALRQLVQVRAWGWTWLRRRVSCMLGTSDRCALAQHGWQPLVTGGVRCWHGGPVTCMVHCMCSR